ncbi:hypothetical protein [Pantoea ananatis]|uniref:hypothetical protein n=1 Tax=Pantoea ananas TaxID=553 RepID=UPI001B30E326|nr:hypothetical protein [Pantoea ananatis]
MGSKSIKHTLNRNGTFYIQFRLANRKLFKKTLKTDSAKQAAAYMAQITPFVEMTQSGEMNVDDLKAKIDSVLNGEVYEKSPATESEAKPIDTLELVTKSELEEILRSFLEGDYQEALRIPRTTPLLRKFTDEPINGKEQSASADRVRDFFSNEYINGSEGTKRMLEAGLRLKGKSGHAIALEVDSAAVQIDMNRALLHQAYQQFYAGDLNGYKNTLLSLKPSETPPQDSASTVGSHHSLSLGQAWKDYKKDKGKGWGAKISDANERYMEVLLTVLGHETDVATITKKDIQKVMAVIAGLPKRVKQPYRSMTIQELISCEDVADEELLGKEALHKHLKLYKSLFKTYLTDYLDILTKSPTDGVVAPPSKARYGAYNMSEMRKFVSYAINEAKQDWLKWIIVLLAYTGARRAEIATLTKSQVKYDEDSQRHYFLIAEGGQGKTENATRQVPIHQHLIDLGFMDYVAQVKTEKLFPDVAGTNMHKIGKTISDVRDQLEIPYLDDHGQRRILHSMRHAVVTTASGGWVSNIAHLQQVIGHEKTGTGITKRYMHTFPLSSVCYVLDGLNWL